MGHGVGAAAVPPRSALRGGLGAAVGVAVDAQAQLLADLEERHPLGGDGDTTAGLADCARRAPRGA